jgi:5-hmdU DNA kinase-like protein
MATAFDKPMFKKLVYWINERESIRKKKEAGAPKPWTKDLVLQQYRFTNVHREDDRVTKWIASNWRATHTAHMWHGMLVARYINRPETLHAIDWPEPWPKKGALVRAKMLALQQRGIKVFTGAYIVSTNGVKTDKIGYVCTLFDRAWQHGNRIPQFKRLEEFYRWLMTINGVGSFMAAQVIADVKHTPLLENAEDWWDWCAPGPGSIRGLMLLRDGEYTKDPKKFVEEMTKLREEVKSEISTKLDLQDLQNVCCEFSKYIRGYSRSRYPGLS